MNLKKAESILQLMADQGVSTIALCPGGRNAPFVKLLSLQNSFEVISFFDERSAGFFALGRARRDQRPVAVCVTSGTALSELHSSVIEAQYSNTPLVILSADRPERLRGTGAPQAIVQPGLFASSVEKTWDITEDSIDFNLSLQGPSHINVCFDEPLVSEDESYEKKFTISAPKQKKFFEKHSQLELLGAGFVILGGLKKEQRTAVEKFLSGLEIPILAEPLSGLNDSKSLQSRLIKSGDPIARDILTSDKVKHIVRIGDVPVGRVWRDIDQLSIPTVSLSDKNFSGTEKSKLIISELLNFDFLNLQNSQWDWGEFKNQDEKQYSLQREIVRKYPQSEIACFSELSELIGSDESVYVGNSLPVRFFSMTDFASQNLWASRGVNGIDGQLSTALGLNQSPQRQWIVLGDLTALYDFSGLWLTDYLKKQEAQVNLVVVNNGGGQIFSRIFSEPLFRNEHKLNFSYIANLWGWDYTKTTDLRSLNLTGRLNLIEVQPDFEQTQSFWQEYDQLWKK